MRTLIITIVALLATQGCKQSETQKVNVTPEEYEVIRTAIIDWMECEECTEGQLESVVRLGEPAVLSLAAILEGGPSVAKLDILEEHLRATYKDLIEYSTTHPENKPENSEEEFVRQYMDNYKALYQSRAAIALGEIGGKSANEALTKASTRNLRSDVQLTVKEALAKIH
jgi:hypothetical protein